MIFFEMSSSAGGAGRLGVESWLLTTGSSLSGPIAGKRR